MDPLSKTKRQNIEKDLERLEPLHQKFLACTNADHCNDLEKEAKALKKVFEKKNKELLKLKGGVSAGLDLVTSLHNGITEMTGLEQVCVDLFKVLKGGMESECSLEESSTAYKASKEQYCPELLYHALLHRKVAKTFELQRYDKAFKMVTTGKNIKPSTLATMQKDVIVEALSARLGDAEENAPEDEDAGAKTIRMKAIIREFLLPSGPYVASLSTVGRQITRVLRLLDSDKYSCRQLGEILAEIEANADSGLYGTLTALASGFLADVTAFDQGWCSG